MEKSVRRFRLGVFPNGLNIYIYIIINKIYYDINSRPNNYSAMFTNNL